MMFFRHIQSLFSGQTLGLKLHGFAITNRGWLGWLAFIPALTKIFRIFFHIIVYLYCNNTSNLVLKHKKCGAADVARARQRIVDH